MFLYQVRISPYFIASRAVNFSEKSSLSFLEVYLVEDCNFLKNYFEHKKIIIATELIKTVSEECNFKDFKVLKEFDGNDFIIKFDGPV